jgi:hypothetical protein
VPARPPWSRWPSLPATETSTWTGKRTAQRVQGTMTPCRPRSLSGAPAPPGRGYPTPQVHWAQAGNGKGSAIPLAYPPRRAPLVPKWRGWRSSWTREGNGLWEVSSQTTNLAKKKVLFPLWTLCLAPSLKCHLIFWMAFQNCDPWVGTSLSNKSLPQRYLALIRSAHSPSEFW